MTNTSSHLTSIPPYNLRLFINHKTFHLPLLILHPELEGILNKLSGKITESQMSQMSQMNYQVGVEGKPATQVARDFLVKQGLLKK